MFSSTIRAAYRSLKDYRERRHAERELSSLDNFLLKDMGISRSEIHALINSRSPRQ